MYYMDNAATTVEKPLCVAEAVYHVLTSKAYGNPSRGTHGYALKAMKKVEEARNIASHFFHAGKNYEIAFTHNATTALNMVLKGLLQKGDHVIATAWDHNAVLRPLYQLQRAGVGVDIIGAEAVTGRLRYDDLDRFVTAKTKALVLPMASNVTGNVVRLDEIKEWCRRKGIFLIVDGAQAAGAIPVDLSDEGIGAFCFTGHKSLYGPGGTGGVCIRNDVPIQPYMTGGDGVQSFSKEQPRDFPGLFEAGTANVAGIAGLAAAMAYLKGRGMENIVRKEDELSRIFYDGLKKLDYITVYGDWTRQRVPVISLNVKGIESTTISDILWQQYEIATRSAFHCAPLMHEALGAARQGTVRFSFSVFTQKNDIYAALDALEKLQKLL